MQDCINLFILNFMIEMNDLIAEFGHYNIFFGMLSIEKTMFCHQPETV